MTPFRNFVVPYYIDSQCKRRAFRKLATIFNSARSALYYEASVRVIDVQIVDGLTVIGAKSRYMILKLSTQRFSNKLLEVC